MTLATGTAVMIPGLAAKNIKDLMSLTKGAEEVCGIPYVMDAYRKEAGKILGCRRGRA